MTDLRILNLTISGFYSASKAAIHGTCLSMRFSLQSILTSSFLTAIGETYSTELAAFSIRVTVVIPGSFRTEKVLGQPMTIHKHVPEYDELRATAAQRFAALAGNERGDPEKAMELLVDVVRGEGKAYGKEWPMWLFMGKDAYRDVRNKCDKVLKTLDVWENVATDLEFEDL